MKELKLITYNVDGLPETLDLNDLPWLLKPVAWVYKVFEGTTVIRVNDNEGMKEKAIEISDRLYEEDADIIGLQEDFNYHEQLLSVLHHYRQGTFMGSIDLSKIFKMVRWLPYPRYKSDGLFLLSQHHPIIKEEIVHWTHSYGYFSHGNDKLTMKGFRRYVIDIGETYIDLYIVHMDADFYNPDTCPDVSGDIKAREKQVEQLNKYIADHPTTNPIVIIGDTNCKDDLGWEEVKAENYSDVDRCFIINNENGLYRLDPTECRYRLDWSGLSDHFPLCVKFNINKNEITE